VNSRTRHILLICCSLLLTLPAAAAEPPAPPTTTADEAIFAAVAPFPVVNSIQLWGAYTNIRTGGDAGTVMLRLDIRWKYTLVPGLKVPNVFTALRVDESFVSLHTPRATANGLTDLFFFDVPLYQFSWGAAGVGFGGVLPSATSGVLGEGKLQLGPAGGIGVISLRPLVFGVFFLNAFSVAGDPSRPDIDRLILQPVVACILPKAFYLRFDPVWVFNWNMGGSATLPVNLSAAHAFNSRLVAFVQPEWITTGDHQKNDFTIRVGLNYLGW
jgi:hypothetical protein